MASFPNKHKSNYNARDLLNLDPEPCAGGAGSKKDKTAGRAHCPSLYTRLVPVTKPDPGSDGEVAPMGSLGQEVHSLGFQPEDQEGRALGTPRGGVSWSRGAGEGVLSLCTLYRMARVAHM